MLKIKLLNFNLIIIKGNIKMNKLLFFVTTDELTDNDIKKINIFGKLIWILYLILFFTFFISAFSFLSINQYFKAGLFSIPLILFISIFEIFYNNHKRELIISKLNNQKKKLLYLDISIFLTIIAVISISTTFAWPFFFLNYLFTPFGHINIINKKLSNNTHFYLKLNGTEHYKLNDKFHREPEDFNGEFYFLPAYIRRFLPCFKKDTMPYIKFPHSLFKSNIDNVWYLFGCKQKRPYFYFLNSENLSKFKDNLNKKHIELINKNF